MNTALIVEDHETVRTWLTEVVASAFPGIQIDSVATISQAIAQIESNEYELAVVDLNLPDGTGTTVIRELRLRSATTFAVVATVFDDDHSIVEALKSGAQGYLLKSEPADRIVASLKGIVANEPPLSPAVSRRILTHFREGVSENLGAAKTTLTARECEVLRLLAKGLNRNEVATILAISATTVASHISAVYRKLDVSSRSEATIEAIRLGLIRA